MTMLPSMLLGVFGLLSVCLLPRGPAFVAAADQATLTLDLYDTEHNYRQSFCDRYALLYNDTSYLASLITNAAATATLTSEADAKTGDAIETTIANVLSGTHLNLIIADDNNIHFNYAEGIGINTTVPGLHADILDYMAEQSNFTWRDSFGIMYAKDITPPDTYTTYLDWSTERYDMVIDYWAPSLERMQLGVTFTESYINGDMILIHNQYKPPAPKINWMNWLLPFTPSVWYATLATILISAMIYPWIEYMGGGLDNVLTIRKWITGRLYLSFINFTGNYAYDPVTPGGCLFCVVFAFWSMLMLASYTANLASLLVVQRIVPPPSIDGIQNAIDHSKSICYPYGTFAGDYLAEMYPRESNNTEIFIPVSFVTAEKYGALNNGTCDYLIEWRNSYDIVKHQKEYNPDCQLVQEGRTIKSMGFSFATMLDPGHMCTLLVKEVFNYYIQHMRENGKLEELWQAHILSQSDLGHCDGIYGDKNTERLQTEDDDSEDDGTAEEEATRQRRFLKSGTGRAAATAGSVMSQLEEGEAEGEELALTIVDMAGTFLLQVVGALAAILVTVLSYLEDKYVRHKKVVRVKRKNRETTITTRDSSYNSDYNGPDDVHDDDDDDDECYPKKNNNGKDQEREPENSSRQREHPSLDRVQKQLNHLQSSHEELKHQNDTIISLLENMTVVSKNTSLDK